MAKETKKDSPVPIVLIPPAGPMPFVPSDFVNKAILRSEFDWRIGAGLTARQALDTALAQIEKNEADAWAAKQSPAKA
jgi:hypothetical protein